jgi:predicted DNA-binding protein YlxM (UPF0122 family)
MKDLRMSYLLDFYGEVLTEKQRDMMQQYFNMDLSLSEIAENFGITRQGVRDAIKRGEFVLTQLESQIGFAKKYKNIVEDVGKIKSIAQKINKNDGFYSLTEEDVRSSALEIIKLCDNISKG